MIDKAKALTIITDIVQNKKEHVDYDRVTKYSALLRKIVTGENQKDLLKRFNLREDEDLFRQREELTISVTKPHAATAMKPVNKIPRVTPLINEIIIEGNEANSKALKEVIKTFYGGENLDTLLEKRFPDLNAYDPNAFMLTLFQDFDHRYTKPIPYVTEISSEQAIYYEHFNNSLQYLVIRGAIKYPTLQKVEGQEAKSSIIYKDGFEYQIYVDNDSITFTQVDAAAYAQIEKQKLTQGIPVINITQDPDLPKSADFYRCDEERVFMVRYFQQKSGRVPAIRIGSIPDPLTDGRTCVSILDNAIPYFMKAIKAVSEMDLTQSLHVFPQKVEYVPRCEGAPNNICKAGYNREGAKCSNCGGTGEKPTTKSSQETIRINMPDEKNIDKMFDLSKLVYYVALPIDVMKFMDEYIDKLEKKIIKSVYNSDIFVKDQVATTATERVIDMDSVYDTLQPIATQYSTIYKHIVYVIGSYLDYAKGLTVNHEFPKDFKFKTLIMLLSDLKAANESESPGFVKQEINQDIAINLYQDRPKELARLKWKQVFAPFDGKTESEIDYVISNKLCARESSVLYAEFKNIFTQLEQEAEEENKFFYDFPYKVQKEKIDAKVKLLLEGIDAESVVTIPFDPHADPNNPAPAPGGPPVPAPAPVATPANA